MPVPGGLPLHLSITHLFTRYNLQHAHLSHARFRRSPITPFYYAFVNTLHLITRVGQNRIYTPYMTVHLVISVPKYRIYTVYIWFWPTLLLTLLLVTCPFQAVPHYTFLLHICLHATTYNMPTSSHARPRRSPITRWPFA